jgi:hypothetical protein
LPPALLPSRDFSVEEAIAFVAGQRREEEAFGKEIVANVSKVGQKVRLRRSRLLSENNRVSAGQEETDADCGKTAYG